MALNALPLAQFCQGWRPEQQQTLSACDEIVRECFSHYKGLHRANLRQYCTLTLSRLNLGDHRKSGQRFITSKPANGRCRD